MPVLDLRLSDLNFNIDLFPQANDTFEIKLASKQIFVNESSVLIE